MNIKEILRQRFFKECCFNVPNNYYGDTRLKTIGSPESLFEWFLSQPEILLSSELSNQVEASNYVANDSASEGASVVTPHSCSSNDIEQAVKRLAKESTAPDKETPDWLEADIRRGMMEVINNPEKYFNTPSREKLLYQAIYNILNSYPTDSIIDKQMDNALKAAQTLLNRTQNVQVSDTTGVDSSNQSDNIIPNQVEKVEASDGNSD